MRLAIEVAFDKSGMRQTRLKALGFQWVKELQGWRKLILDHLLEEEIAQARESGFRAWVEEEG
jgi:hypothetical protein